MSESTNWPAVENLPRDTLGLRIIPPKYPFWNEALEANREDLGSLLYKMQNSRVTRSLLIPAAGWMKRESPSDGYPLYIDVACTAATSAHYAIASVDRTSTGAAEKAGLCPALETLEGYLRFWAKYSPGENMIVTVTLLAGSDNTSIQSVTIPAAGWTAHTGEEYKFYIDVACEGATAACFPSVSLDVDALEAAKNAGLSPSVQPLESSLRLWSRYRPTTDLAATVLLIGASGQPGSGSVPDTSGYTIATNSEVSEAINSIFG